MPHFESSITAVLFYILAGVAGLFLLWLGYRIGRLFAGAAAAKIIASKEQELFTAQKGFKQLYEQELADTRRKNAELEQRVKTLEARVEDYRKKAAGLGGLFSTGGKRADAMYALLLENEALEEALLAQNAKLSMERQEAVKEQLRNNSYRRTLISHLLSDERIKSYVSEVISDDKRLPSPDHPPDNHQPAPPHDAVGGTSH